ncbi:MAG TPA: hypothetical protein DFK12_13510 [Gallionellaceae bacterium]|jgi:hypothetical protein|nr:hypothetical protein [Gallionellaceae bacterium]
MAKDFDFSDLSDSAEIPLCDIAGLSKTLTETADPAPVSLPKLGKEHRTVQRYMVKWRVAAFVDHQELHHGHLKDISIKGAAILLERNLQSAEFVKLHIYVPPPAPSRIPCIIEVVGKVIYSIYDAKDHRFRVGVNFLKFATEHDPVFLADHLESRALTVVF